MENACHWTLDVTFREDDSRTRERTLANNLSWLRRFAVTLLKRHPDKDSIRGKMLHCGYSTDFLFNTIERIIAAVLPKVGLETVKRPCRKEHVMSRRAQGPHQPPQGVAVHELVRAGSNQETHR